MLCSVRSNSWRPPGLEPTRLLCPLDFPGKNTGLVCHFLFQQIFPTQGSNPHLLHWQVDSLPLSHQGSPQTQPSLYPNLRLPASRPVRKFNSVVEATQSRYLVSAAAAKSLQSCPTLCDPIDGSLPGSSVPGILQARTLEWVAISFSNA